MDDELQQKLATTAGPDAVVDRARFRKRKAGHEHKVQQYQTIYCYFVPQQYLENSQTNYCCCNWKQTETDKLNEDRVRVMTRDDTRTAVEDDDVCARAAPPVNRKVWLSPLFILVCVWRGGGECGARTESSNNNIHR